MSSGTALFLLDAGAVALLWPALLALSCGGACWHAGPDGVAALIFPLTNLLAFYALGLYRRETLLELQGSLVRLPLAIGLGTIGALFATSLATPVLGHTAHRGELFADACLGFYAAGVATRVLHWSLRRAGVFRRSLLVVGAGARAYDLCVLLAREGSAPHYRLTFVHDPAFGPMDARLADLPGAEVIRSEARTLLDTARQVRADLIVVAPDERRGMALEPLLDCKIAGFPVKQYLAFLEREIRRVDVKRLELGWLLYADGFTIGELDLWLKRALDVAAALVMLVLFSPAILGAAIAIKLGDGGPVLYRQERVTRGGRRFFIQKMRTMRIDAEQFGAVWATEHDPRITRVGRFLRKTRIDEFPQLWNVLRGDMSLVGPRPERPGFVADLAAKLPLYNERHAVKAGLTGWAQVNYPYGASLDDARSKLSYDLYYVKNFSVLLDVLILLQTLRVVLFQSGAR